MRFALLVRVHLRQFERPLTKYFLFSKLDDAAYWLGISGSEWWIHRWIWISTLTDMDLPSCINTRSLHTYARKDALI